MNTATRAIPSQTLGLGRLHNFSLGANGFWLVVLMLALFLSAFAIIYVKDLNRRLMIESQLLEKENVAANEHWGKLLLEQSTLASQSRIHQQAERSLGMITPDPSQFKFVKDPI